MSSTLKTLSVHVPLSIRRRGGRKVVITPDGATAAPAATRLRTRADPTLVKALARAFRWKRMLETGHHASISEIATAEKIDRGYIGCILRLTLLAPDIIEAIMDGRQPADLMLARLLDPFPASWAQQRAEGLGPVARSGAAAERPAPYQQTRAVTSPGRRPAEQPATHEMGASHVVP